jgi:hypothetical protein
MSSIANLGIVLAEELRRQSEQDAAVTAMDAVAEAARKSMLSDDQCFRLLGRLWTLQAAHVLGLRRLGAEGINLNEYPPAAAYLFGKQIYDESTQKMQFADEILRRRPKEI